MIDNILCVNGGILCGLKIMKCDSCKMDDVCGACNDVGKYCSYCEKGGQKPYA